MARNIKYHPHAAGGTTVVATFEHQDRLQAKGWPGSSSIHGSDVHRLTRRLRRQLAMMKSSGANAGAIKRVVEQINAVTEPARTRIVENGGSINYVG